MTLAKQVRIKSNLDNDRCYITEKLISTTYRPVPHLSPLSANRVIQAFGQLEGLSLEGLSLSKLSKNSGSEWV